MALSQAVQDIFRQTSTGGRAPALADNSRVGVVINPSKKDIGYIEREPFSSKTDSPNNAIKALRMRFVIPEGEPNANRNFFSNIPVRFEIWSANQSKNIPSYSSIGLVKALGYALEDLDEDSLEKLTDRELLNKKVELVLGVEDDPRFDRSNADEMVKAAQNPLYAKRNTIKFINPPSVARPAGTPVPAGGYGQAPAAAPATASDPWATPAAGGATDPWAAAPSAANEAI
jgi:hypothetical protein